MHADPDPGAAFLGADTDLIGVRVSVGLVTEFVEMGVLASATAGFVGVRESAVPGVLVSIVTGVVGL